MTEEQLHELGLSPSQAKAYLLLVQEGKLTPAQLMAKTGESRTNAYMVLDRLAELGLAIKDEVQKKLVFRAGSPIALQKLAERSRERAYASEVKIKQAMPELLKYFNERRNQPGVRFLQGRENLLKAYKEHLKVGGDAVVFRTTADDAYFGEDLYDYMEERAKQGVTAELISPYSEGAEQFTKDNPHLKRELTWVPAEAYTAPVEIFTYGTTTSITSFGEEAVATLIESPQIADAMRQIFALAKVGAKQLDKKHNK